MLRATTMAAAFVNAIVKQDPKQTHWVSRTVIDRAKYTNVGNVQERDVGLHLSNRTAKALGLSVR